MGIFDFLKREPKKNKYELLHDSISEILELLDRKFRLVVNLETDGSIVDLEFNSLMIERMKLVDLIKSGSISFLGDDLKDELLEIFNDEVTNKKTMMIMWSYLSNEQSKLKKLF